MKLRLTKGVHLVVPRERLPDWPMDRWQMWAGPSKHFLVFPVRHGEMVNYVGFVPTDEEMKEDSIEELKTRRNDAQSGKVDEDEVEAAESFELPGADLSHEELTVRVLPRQSDEFTCAGCFLVRHRSQIAEEKASGEEYCFDCAG